MSFSFIKKPRLFAFDLDGTLLNSKKELSSKTIKALAEISDAHMLITFASGRIKSSIRQYLQHCSFPVSILALNGATVYADSKHGDRKIYDASLSPEYADYPIEYSEKNFIAANYYFDEQLYAVKNQKTAPWLELYFNQTRSTYVFESSLNRFFGKSPSKIIFISSPQILDEQQRFFTKLWGSSIYLCRTWDYYLEFLNPLANKGLGLKALADFYQISMDEIISFGDALNDIPMLQMAGFSVAVNNASEEVKNAAKRVSTWDNDQDAIMHEWELIKKTLFLRSCK